jgi:uncharacterized membrane protein YhaH (DUF805 family)
MVMGFGSPSVRVGKPNQPESDHDRLAPGGRGGGRLELCGAQSAHSPNRRPTPPPGTPASRSEYWYFILFLVIVSVALTLTDLAIWGLNDRFILPSIFSLATAIPSLSALVRRLHDIGRSGWWMLIGLIPLVGVILLIYWSCQPSMPSPNDYGPPPS